VKFAAFIFALAPAVCATAEPLLPSTEGMTWKYEMTQEKPAAEIDLEKPTEKERFPISYRIAGTQKIDNLEFLKMEMDRDNVRVSTDLIREGENGVICAARMDGDKLVSFDPPQAIVATPLKAGAKWKFDGKIGDRQVTQQYEISGEEGVEVAAGKFRAWRIHCNQTFPSAATIDRWLVPGVGFVKIRTEIKTNAGTMLQRTSLELKEMPKVGGQPEPIPSQSGEKLIVGVLKNPKGEPTTAFDVSAPAIYARWQGRGLPAKAKIRATFIAENVVDVAADYEIDDADTVAPSPNSGGLFTLSKPEDGWIPGDYRVEFFVNDEPAGAVKFKITK